jgi:hypothetical protein
MKPRPPTSIRKYGSTASEPRGPGSEAKANEMGSRDYDPYDRRDDKENFYRLPDKKDDERRRETFAVDQQIIADAHATRTDDTVAALPGYTGAANTPAAEAQAANWRHLEEIEQACEAVIAALDAVGPPESGVQVAGAQWRIFSVEQGFHLYRDGVARDLRACDFTSADGIARARRRLRTLDRDSWAWSPAGASSKPSDQLRRCLRLRIATAGLRLLLATRMASMTR